MFKRSTIKPVELFAPYMEANLKNIQLHGFRYYYGFAKHERAISAWTQSTVQSFVNFPLMQFVDKVSPRPILMIAGENAHSRYFSEDVYKQAKEPKELLIIPDADHVDMYYNMDKIPFDKIESFFAAWLKKERGDEA